MIRLQLVHHYSSPMASARRSMTPGKWKSIATTTTTSNNNDKDLQDVPLDDVEMASPPAFAPSVPNATATAQPQQYTVSPQLYNQQLAQSRKRNCLIGGSIAATVGLFVCICFLLPIIIFLIVFFQMRNDFNNNISSDPWN